MSFLSKLPRCLRIVRVSGDSMTPSLNDGDYLVISSLKALKVGRIAVLNHPNYGVMVKRIDALTSTHVLLRGDNPLSVSSDAMGWVDRSAVKGVVIKVVTKVVIKKR